MAEPPSTGDAAGYHADLFAPLFEAEAGHFWFRARNRCIAAAARSLPQAGSIRSVIEHGCGTGFVLAELQRVFPQAEVTGADLFAEGLAYARRRFSGRLLQVDVLASGFAEAFDLIGLFDVLEHLDDDAAVLRALWKQLRPGGVLLLTVPAHAVLWSNYDVWSGHRRRYTRRALRARLIEAGFRVEYCTEFMCLLFPLLWARRRLRWGRRADPAVGGDATSRSRSELAVHPWLNRALDWLLRPEAWCVARRLALAPGTSLLALASRPK